MQLLLIAQAIAALVAVSYAKPVPQNHVLHEKRHAAYTGYTKRSRIDGAAVIPVRIGLKQTGLENAHEHLMDVSHPTSPNYGKHWTADEVINAFAPSDESVNAVYNWLIESGIPKYRIVHTENKGWFAFEATVEEAENLFYAEFFEHVHASTGTLRVGCDEYHLPQHIKEHVDYVTPGVKLSSPVKKKIDKRGGKWSSSGPVHVLYPPTAAHLPEDVSMLPPDLQDCGRNVTPACIQALYDIPAAPIPAVEGNTFGIFEEGDFYAQKDLDLFFKAYAPYVPRSTHPDLNSVDGGHAPVAEGDPKETGESLIDFDIAYSLTYPQPLVLYQVDDLYYSNEAPLPGFLNTFLDAIDGSYCTYCYAGECGDDPNLDPVYPDHTPKIGFHRHAQCGKYKPTNVISVSYGEAEFDLPAYYEERQCNEFLKLGLQGVSVFVSSSDYGVASYPGDDTANGCLGPEAAAGLGIFSPDWPSSCPWLTAVGGTQLYAYQTVLDAESVLHVDLGGTAVNFSSGGGFSNNFPRPSYQDAAVTTYLNEHVPPYPYYEGPPDFATTSGLYNRAGRGYPDVSANGAYLRAYLDEKLYHFFGTSLSSPIWGSIITLINGERIKAGKGTVGFVNPVLYAHPEVLHDIVNGTNVGCGTQGFHASPGWDASTGLGTPDYPALLSLFMSLP